MQELESGPHVIQLHRKILCLHWDFENLTQIGDCLVAAQRQERDFLAGIISLGKERKALDVVPVKVREPDKDFVLLVADGAEVSAEVPQSCTRIDNGDAVHVGQHDLEAGGVAAELLKTRIADGDGSPRTVKLELHRIVLMKVSFRGASIKRGTHRTASATVGAGRKHHVKNAVLLTRIALRRLSVTSRNQSTRPREPCRCEKRPFPPPTRGWKRHY